METPAKKWKLAIGLGNPGKEYERTYHNAGEAAVETIAGGTSDLKTPFSVFGRKPFEYMKKGGVILIKPKTFMNESGKAVTAAMKHFGAKTEDIVVMHDDSDIPLGEYKVEYGRGNAGHNGVSSVMKTLGTHDFWRIRIGVRGEPGIKAGDFVLKKMPPRDSERLDKALSEIKTLYFEGHGE